MKDKKGRLLNFFSNTQTIGQKMGLDDEIFVILALQRIAARCAAHEECE